MLSRHRCRSVGVLLCQPTIPTQATAASESKDDGVVGGVSHEWQVHSSLVLAFVV